MFEKPIRVDYSEMEYKLIKTLVGMNVETRKEIKDEVAKIIPTKIKENIRTMVLDFAIKISKFFIQNTEDGYKELIDFASKHRIYLATLQRYDTKIIQNKSVFVFNIIEVIYCDQKSTRLFAYDIKVYSFESGLEKLCKYYKNFTDAQAQNTDAIKRTTRTRKYIDWANKNESIVYTLGGTKPFNRYPTNTLRLFYVIANERNMENFDKFEIALLTQIRGPFDFCKIEEINEKLKTRHKQSHRTFSVTDEGFTPSELQVITQYQKHKYTLLQLSKRFGLTCDEIEGLAFVYKGIPFSYHRLVRNLKENKLNGIHT